MESVALKSLYARVAYLAACALSDKCPDASLLSGVSVEKLYLLARRHGMGALITHSLERLSLATDEMRAESLKSARKIMLLDAERTMITRELDSRGIRHISLKGVVIKELYPKIGLREMSDNDILFDSGYRAEVRDIFKSRGYTVNLYGKDKNHDTYVKAPVYNYEMHVALFGSRAFGDAFSRFFDGALDRAVEGEGSLRMTDEDFYIYMKAHEYKHYATSGVGLRLFADTFVYLTAKRDILDRDYINEVAEKIGISGYMSLSESLAMKLMDPDTAAALVRGEDVLTEEECELFLYCATSGSYGYVSRYVKNGIERTAEGGKVGARVKLKYIWHRLFPPSDWYRINSPFAYKHRWARPFALIRRFFKTLFTAPKRLTVPLATVLKYKGKDKNKKK